MVEEERRQGDETRPPLSHPAGSSQRRWGSEGTKREDVLCGMCGTTQEGHENTLNRVLGRQIVEGCCGAVIDVLYQEHGEDFAVAFLDELAKDPTNPRFGFFRRKLVETLKRAQENIQEVSAVLAESQSIVEAIG